ncbi:MAG: hypothetical protein C0605_02110 [Hyphomicrobiales bacterium]|nr:MAG: hypothetical protein C0605_02110 [Hyphomicrobiales bacterium]
MSDTPESPQPAAAPPARRNWLKILLIISVSLNLLIAGAIISRFVAVKRMIQAQGMGAPGLMLREGRRIMRAVSPERRDELHKMVRPHREILARSRAEIAGARAEIARLMRAEPLDKAAFTAALQKLDAAENKAHRTVTQLRQEFLLALTPEERRRYVESMLRHPHRGRFGRGMPRGGWNRP